MCASYAIDHHSDDSCCTQVLWKPNALPATDTFTILQWVRECRGTSTLRKLYRSTLRLTCHRYLMCL